MDRDLLRQSLSYHGQSLFSLLRSEQIENPDFNSIAADLSKSVPQRDAPGGTSIVEQFVARKADLLFSPSWKSTSIVQYELQEETSEPYAVMPPLEQFMEVPEQERKDLFYRDVERGDVIIGRITSIREFGFFVALICTGGGLERDVEDLELTALCPIREVPSTRSHDDPLSYYQIGDLIRAGVKDVDRYQEKITISLHLSSLCPSMGKTKLGVISKEDLPLHYSRGASDCCESYEKILESSLGFSNPTNVDVLLVKLGIDETLSPSLMRGLQKKHFLEEDFADNIRKKQSASWALKCVKTGVDHFKAGRHVEAMNEYNKALEIDTNNVEALVARGALYATKGSLVKAIDDFELALETCPSHRNAKKYLCQTLVERGGQLEEEKKLVTAEGLYKKALTLDDSFREAEDALRKLQMHIQKTLKLREQEMAKEQEKAKTVETSAEKLRKILKEEKRMKRKRRRSSSSSSSSSSSDATSSSSSRQKSKKKKHKRRHSSHSHKKRQRRVSSHGYRSDEEDAEESYPAPANTSASFINQKHAVAQLFEDERSQGMSKSSGSFCASSAAEVLEDSRGRFEDDPFECSPCPAEPGKAKDRHGDKCLGSKPLERDVNGRERVAHSDHRKSDTPHMVCKKRVSSTSESSAHRRYSSSSAGSEYSHKSETQSRDIHSQGMSSHRWSDADKKESRDSRRSEGNGHRSCNDYSQKSRRFSEGGQKKELPSNLVDIFSQIAQFEKEKSTKQKK
ncbi:tetratricopeptide repeat protein 14 isoform X2 [Denticeps clupeoides]|uniref:tetratricopeptide repeat protein 14 isoform X2 n=1 Tax=Denticeps clupeoides TaxID=299321 RepID=UPI0010A4EFFC|nr:tetratricopeptide repeat protein 14 isoform X2 [Denticeps clupeoides]